MEDRWCMLFQTDKCGVNGDVLGEAGEGGVGIGISGIDVGIGEAFADDEDEGGSGAVVVFVIWRREKCAVWRRAQWQILLRALHVVAGHQFPGLRCTIGVVEVRPANSEAIDPAIAVAGIEIRRGIIVDGNLIRVFYDFHADL